MNAEREPAQEAVFGSPEWAAAFTDDEGDIFKLSPDRKIRKLTREEVDQLISEAALS